MPEICCIGDTIIGVCDHGEECCPHNVTGFFVEGSDIAASNGKGLVRDGDRCWTTCPHCATGYAVGGSSKVFIDDKPVHRKGDMVKLGAGTGHSITASSRIMDHS